MPVVQVPGSASLSSNDLIEIARNLTENKGTYNRGWIFTSTLQEFCEESRWYWRKLQVRFLTEVGVSEYDLTDESVVDTSATGSMPVQHFQKFLRNGIKIFTNATNHVCPSPLFEEDAQNILMESGDSVSAGLPGQYFLIPGTKCTIKFDKPADAVYPVRVFYWAIPDIDPTSIPTTVPIVPSNLYHMLVKGMVKRIYQVLSAQGSASYAAAYKVADADYREYLMKAQMTKDWADGRVVEYRDNQGEAIQSTS